MFGIIFTTLRRMIWERSAPYEEKSQTANWKMITNRFQFMLMISLIILFAGLAFTVQDMVLVKLYRALTLISGIYLLHIMSKNH